MPRTKPETPDHSAADTTTVRCDPELRNLLKVYAAKTRMTMLQAVNEALTDYLKSKRAFTG
jgi:hypothetical protein